MLDSEMCLWNLGLLLAFKIGIKFQILIHYICLQLILKGFFEQLKEAKSNEVNVANICQHLTGNSSERNFVRTNYFIYFLERLHLLSREYLQITPSNSSVCEIWMTKGQSVMTKYLRVRGHYCTLAFLLTLDIQ